MRGLRLHALRTGHTQGVLLRQTTKKTFDAMGRISRISMTYAPVSAEEFDQVCVGWMANAAWLNNIADVQAVNKAPDMCIPSLVSLFGSVSTGQELLYDEQ